VLTAAGAGTRVVLDLQGLPPGGKGVHIHAVGKCEPPAFTSAGGHGHLDTTTARVSLVPGGPASLFDADGSSLVVHAGPDDMKTDPAGNSGARIACGVSTRAPCPRDDAAGGRRRSGAGCR
jgi:Cu-Zn family superoxide dismutase